MEDILRAMPVCENCEYLKQTEEEVICTKKNRDTGLLQQCKDDYKNKYGYEYNFKED